MRRYLTSILVSSVLAPAALISQPSANTPAAVVAIAVNGARATVEARYAFAGNPGAMSFEYLEQPCTAVGPINLESDGVPVSYARASAGPWVRLHDTSAVNPARTSLGYRIAYDVQLSSDDVSIPIVVPTSVLPTARRGEPVAALVVELSAQGRVIFPRMNSAGIGNRWATHMVALPSAVRVSGTASGAECESPADSGDGGGLARIFWALVVTLAIWVSAYLYWATRERQPA